MNRLSLLVFILILLVSAPIAGQRPTPAPTPSSSPAPQKQLGIISSNDEVVRVTTNLVQVDAVVMDPTGLPVADLQQGDFEIFEDGRAQQITNFSYVAMNPSTTAQPPVPNPAVPTVRSAPARLRPEQVRRTIALVVDDLGLSPESANHVRRALRQFVDYQMQVSDLVAVIRTSGGASFLQGFTADRQQLYAAIERVRPSNNGMSALAPIFVPPYTIKEDVYGLREDLGPRREAFAVGTLNALSQVVNGLRQLPGRKSLVLFSEGFPLVERDRSGGAGRFKSRSLVNDPIDRLIDAANRASVVFYSIDTRGIATAGLTAVDDLAEVMKSEGPPGVRVRLGNRSADFADSQQSLNYLAQSTGGLFIRSNDLEQALRRALNDQRGYYLIGYRPDVMSIDPATGRPRFHEISVRVKRPGLRVRSRSGFLGGVEAARPARRSRVDQLSAALVSPFAASGMHLRLTPLFGNDRDTGSFVRLLLYMDARDFSFTAEAGGWYKTIIDVLAVTVGESEHVVHQVSRTETIRVRGNTYQLLLRDGLLYFFNVPIKHAGAYQLRVAVRDAASERVGSASQFVTVPDLGKDRLALSGLVLNGDLSTPPGSISVHPSAAADANRVEGLVEDIDSQSSPAVRRFRRGTSLAYRYAIYNARADPVTQRPQLTIQVRLFHDGQQVFAGPLANFKAGTQPATKRIMAGGLLQLGAELRPGEYVLQIVVTDSLAKEEYRTATQWIDFEIH